MSLHKLLIIILVASGGALMPRTLVPLGALESSVNIRALISAYSAPLLSDFRWGGTVESTLDLRSERNPVVRGRLEIKATLLADGSTNASTDSPTDAVTVRALFDVPRANIRFRVPITDDYRIRFTVGRARLTWGQGQLFNAGDLLFGTNTTEIDFTEDIIRDETAILLAVFIPINDFAFVEVAGLPPFTALTDVPLRRGAGGARLQGKIANWVYEVGYLYNGDENAHNIALNLQGNLGADVYLSATSALVHGTDLVNQLFQRTQITVGAHYAINLPNNWGLNLRLESLWRPAGAWREGDSADTRYALLLYPEVTLSISSTLQVFLRSLFSPIDLSAQITGGVSWVPYSGLSVLFFPSINLGQSNDTFHIGQPGGLQVTIGVDYTF